MARLQQVQANRLPDEILSSLTARPPPLSATDLLTTKMVAEESVGNKSPRTEGFEVGRKKVFNSDSEEEEEDNSFLALDTKATRFEVVAPRDLSSDKFKNAAAWSFRERMLFSQKRVRREDHRQKRVQAAKRAAGGKNGFVRAGKT